MFLRPLKFELKKKTEGELNEVPSRIEEDLDYIKEWLKKQKHLNVRKDDQWLISFLRGCKFSLQRTKEKIDYFYTMRVLLPEFFSNRDPLEPDIQEILNAGAVLPLPNTKGKEGPRVVMFRWKVCNPDRIPLATLIKIFFMSLDILMNEDDNCVISGVCVWVDYTEFPLNYILQHTPSTIKKCLLCLENAYPLRVKSIYCTNAPSPFETIFNLIKSLMSKKLQERAYLYSTDNFDKVYKDIPKSIMPKEYGGNSESVSTLAEHWKKKVESYREWFLEDAKYCSNEKLRYGIPKTTSEIFGVEGSFRKLTID